MFEGRSHSKLKDGLLVLRCCWGIIAGATFNGAIPRTASVFLGKISISNQSLRSWIF